MTTELASYSARLREIISPGCSAVPGVRRAAPADDSEFNALALELFEIQFACNAPYRRFCEARGMKPGTVESWRSIPSVPAAAFKELELTCLAPPERTTVFHSSGTTAQRPSRHFHSVESLALYEASLWAWFQRHIPIVAGPSAGGGGAAERAKPAEQGWQLCLLTPSPGSAPHSSLVYMFDTIRRRCGASGECWLGEAVENAWTVDAGRAAATIEKAAAEGARLIVLGTAFNFVHLLDELGGGSKRHVLPEGSAVMETGGYKGRSRELPKSELHRLITQRLGVPPARIICEYGMSELSSQAYDGVAGEGLATGDAGGSVPEARDIRRFAFPPWVRALIISPETGNEVSVGETGLIRVYDLANAFSVMAVQTEDRAMRRDDGFELLGRAPAAEPRGCSLKSQRQ